MKASLAAGLLALALLAFAPAAEANTPQECISLWAGYTKAGQTQGIAQQDFMAACLEHKVSLAPPPSSPQAAPPAPPAFAATASTPSPPCRWRAATTTAAWRASSFKDHVQKVLKVFYNL